MYEKLIAIKKILLIHNIVNNQNNVPRLCGNKRENE